MNSATRSGLSDSPVAGTDEIEVEGSRNRTLSSEKEIRGSHKVSSRKKNPRHIGVVADNMIDVFEVVYTSVDYDTQPDTYIISQKSHVG